MSINSRAGLVIAVVSLVASSRGHAQQAEPTASLRGRVVNATDGSPVAGADVWVISSQQRVETDSSGAFRLVGLIPGPQLLQIECKGPVLLHTAGDKCSHGGAPDCFVSVFIDGVLRYSARMAEQGARPIDLNHESVSNFSGVEYYADNGTAPAGMHADDEGCGTLWLWTREK